MPNWVHHSMTITGPQSERDRFLRVCITTDKDGDRNLDFNRLLPEPSWEEENKSPKADCAAPPDRYEWHCRHWGTKWNACRTALVVEADQIEIGFHTAWSPPTPILDEIGERFPLLRVEGGLDEETGHFAADFVIADGKVKYVDRPDRLTWRDDTPGDPEAA